MARHKHVINVSEVEPKEIAVGDKFHHIVRGLGSSTGNVELGCSHFRVAPGKYAFRSTRTCATRKPFTSSKGSARSPSETTRSRCRRATTPPCRSAGTCPTSW